MSSRAEIWGLVGTLTNAVVLEDDASDGAIAAQDTGMMCNSFHELALLRARLGEAQREASEAN